MSALNQIRFNSAQFNIHPAAEIWIGIGFTERVTALIATSEKSYLDADGYENIHNDSNAANPGRMLRIAGQETVSGSFRGCVFFRASGIETVSGNNSISQFAWVSICPVESISQSGVISANNWFYLGAAEAVSMSGYIGQLFFEAGESSEVVDASVSAVALDEMICELAVTLRPGQVIVIDANNYNVLVDGENAIHIQNGAWLDELNRETQNIRITADYPANLSATILYTERYL